MRLFSAIIAVLLLNERLASWHLLGGGLTLCGVIMAQTLTRPLVRRAASPRTDSTR